MSGDFVVVKDHPDLLLYVDSLQRKNALALSFYPRSTFERESAKGRVLLGMLNGEPCGYVYFGALGGNVCCHQVCIQYEARRRFYGAALVAVMEAEAAGSHSITLRCGFDLDANEFWQDMGYSCIGNVPGGARRMRTLNIWRKQIQPLLFAPAIVEPMRGERDARLWTRHRKRGVITQFARGKRLAEYRAAIESAESTPSPLP